MPLHDFVCRSCGETFEALEGPGKQPLCPKCGSAELDKLPAVFAAHTNRTKETDLRCPAGDNCGNDCPYK